MRYLTQLEKLLQAIRQTTSDSGLSTSRALIEGIGKEICCCQAAAEAANGQVSYLGRDIMEEFRERLQRVISHVFPEHQDLYDDVQEFLQDIVCDYYDSSDKSAADTLHTSIRDSDFLDVRDGFPCLLSERASIRDEFRETMTTQRQRLPDGKEFGLSQSSVITLPCETYPDEGRYDHWTPSLAQLNRAIETVMFDQPIEGECLPSGNSTAFCGVSTAESDHVQPA